MSKRHPALLFIILMILPFNLHAASVWKVTKGDDVVIIGGTIHFLSQQDYPLPDEYERAYKQADLLVFETDINRMETPEFQQLSMQMMLLKDGKSLADFISSSTLTLLQQHLLERNIPVENFMPFKPGFLPVVLSVIELQMMGISSTGVDGYYATKAKGDGKQQDWFESPEEQMLMLENMGKGDEDNMIAYTLEDLKDMRSIMPKMMSAWRSGDADALTRIGINDMKADYPQVYADLLVTRNAKWIPKVESFFGNNKTEFVLVGALHLVGPDSVLEMLKKDGYAIEKY